MANSAADASLAVGSRSSVGYSKFPSMLKLARRNENIRLFDFAGLGFMHGHCTVVIHEAGDLSRKNTVETVQSEIDL